MATTESVESIRIAVEESPNRGRVIREELAERAGLNRRGLRILNAAPAVCPAANARGLADALGQSEATMQVSLEPESPC